MSDSPGSKKLGFVRRASQEFKNIGGLLSRKKSREDLAIQELRRRVIQTQSPTATVLEGGQVAYNGEQVVENKARRAAARSNFLSTDPYANANVSPRSTTPRPTATPRTSHSSTLSQQISSTPQPKPAPASSSTLSKQQRPSSSSSQQAQPASSSSTSLSVPPR